MFLIVETLIDPIGEFPLNDDWAYAGAVDGYLKSGNIQFSFWQEIIGLPQFFIGIMVCKFFGFSFIALRSISIVFVMIMTAIMNAALSQFDVRPFTRFILLLIFVFNPLTLCLGNTFMPDVTQLFLTLLSFLLILKYLQNNKYFYLLLFTLFSLFATLNRQTGLVVPVIFGAIYFYISQKSTKTILVSLIPFLINFFGIYLYEYICKQHNKLPGNYNLQINNIILKISHPTVSECKTIMYYFITSTICLGLFILPITISNINFHFGQIKRSAVLKGTFAAYTILVLVKIIFSGNIFPFVGNVFYHLGIGPVILTGFNTQEELQVSGFAKCVWLFLNFIGGFSFFCAMTSVILKVNENRKEKYNFTGWFFILLLLFYLIPICFNYANDRYLLGLLPFFLLAYVLSFDQVINKLKCFLVLIPLFYFSMAGVHDYLSINRARCKASQHLTNELNIPPNKIDGGFEFNGRYCAGQQNYIPSHIGRWWWVYGDEYMISPIEQFGYSIETEYEFSSWMSFKFNKMYVLHKL